MRRLLRIVFYFFILSTLVLLLATLALSYALKKNGITYTEKDFDLPLKLTVKGLQINQTGFVASFEDVEIDLLWKGLFKGQISGDYLIIKNGSIQQTISATDTTQTEDPFSISDFSIHLQKILLSNICFSQYNSGDTLALTFPELNIYNLNMGDSWQIDSLTNLRSKLDYLHYANDSVTNENVTGKQPAFSFAEMPEFTINSLRFIDCEFDFATPEQRHSITGFDLALNGLKDKDLLNVAVTKFSMCYQDTIDVNLNLGKVTLNDKEKIEILNLHFDFPWLKLQIPQLEFSNLDSPKLHILFKDSYFNTALLKYFLPKMKLPFEYEPGINFGGEITFFNNRIGLEQFDLQLSNTTNLKIVGFADLPSKPDAEIQLNINDINTSYSEIAQLLGYQVPAGQKEIKIHSGILLSGTYENLQADGILRLNDITLNLSANYSLNSKNEINLIASLKSAFIDPSLLFSSPDIDLKLFNFQLSGQAFIGNQLMNGFSLKLLSDSIYYNEQHISNPNVEFWYDKNLTKASIHLSDILRVSLSSADDLMSDEFTFDGSVDCSVPQLLDLNQNAGDLYSQFKGRFQKAENSFDFSLVSDTIRFLPSVSKDVYQTKGILKAGINNNGDMRLDFSVAGHDIIHFKGSGNTMDWLGSNEKWKGNYPATEFDLAMHIDSTLMFHLTGLHASLQLENLQLKSQKDEIEASLNLPSVVFNDFEWKDIKGNFEYSDNNLQSDLTVSLFQNPYAILKDIKILVEQESSQKVGVSVTASVPEISNSIELSTILGFSDSTYTISLDDEKLLRFGGQNWRKLKSRGFVFNHDFTLLSGELTIADEAQKINIETSDDAISLKIDSLNLSPLFQLMTNDTTFQAHLNASAGYQLDDASISWLFSINDLKINNIKLGTFRSDGLSNEKLLRTHFALNEKYGRLDLAIRKDENPLSYDLKIDNLDVNFLNSTLSPWQDAMPFTGFVNAKLDGSYDTRLNSTGYISFDNIQTYLTDYKVYLKADQDTLWFKDSEMIARNFKIYDIKGNYLTLDGSLSIEKDLLMDVTLKSKKFSLLEAGVKHDNLQGSVDITSDLRIKNGLNELKISGNLAVLPNSSLRYVYESTVSIDEREKEITFVSFEKMDKTKVVSEKERPENKSGNPIEWDVNLEIAKSDVTIILSETAQDQIKMTTDGNFLLKTGDNNEPFLFGTLQSKEGSIIYDAPAVSDLNFMIENLEVYWNGDMYDPKITFLGSEIFRVSPKGIPGMTNSNTVVPITVLARVNDRPINDFALVFDMNSNNAQVKSWILSLPADTREATAINLLLFGSLNFGETGGSSSYLQGLVGKMNEISRRNIKNADVSFYVDNENMSESSAETTDKLGYSLSKALFDKKMKISVGGSIDLSNSSSSTQKNAVALGNVQLDYIVSKNPEITLILSQKNTYDGVINGQINESSVGVTYQKSFRNFFKFFNKKGQQ